MSCSPRDHCTSQAALLQQDNIVLVRRASVERNSRKRGLQSSRQDKTAEQGEHSSQSVRPRSHSSTYMQRCNIVQLDILLQLLLLFICPMHSRLFLAVLKDTPPHETANFGFRQSFFLWKNFICFLSLGPDVVVLREGFKNAVTLIPNSIFHLKTQFFGLFLYGFQIWGFFSRTSFTDLRG